MCCFSGTVEQVTRTSIFARREGPWQFLVYAMTLETLADVAMILPLPVVREGNSPLVKFLSLEDYPEFFVHLRRCFPVPQARGGRGLAFAAGGAAPLAVERVGAFEASFVPSVADFADWIRVFGSIPPCGARCLRTRTTASPSFNFVPAKPRVHPMAFRFRTRSPGSLFFPTVHVHDGTWSPEADFDHDLYAQHLRESPERWAQGSVIPVGVMDFGNHVVSDRTQGIVQPRHPVFRRSMFGQFANADVWASD